MSDDAQLPERLAYSPAEVAAMLGVSRNTVYELMQAGQLPSVTIGARRIIKVEDIRELLEDGAEAPDKEEAEMVKTGRYHGKPVIDATEPVTFHVGADDVATAVPGDCNRCALALAGRRTTGRNVAIRKMYPLIEHDDHYVRYQLSSVDRGIITGFDEKGVFPPGTSFTLQVPKVKLGTFKPTGPKKVKTGKSTKPRVMRARTRDSRLPHDI